MIVLPRLINSKILLVLVFFTVASVMMSSQAFADVTSPRKQIELGITEDDVICRDGLVKAERISTESSVCIKSDSVKKFVDRGVIKSINPDKIKEVEKIVNQSVGTIEKITLVKDLVNTKDNTIDISGYYYTFKVCAKDSPILLPEIILKSDSVTKRISLVEKILPNKCDLNVARITAINHDSITAILTNQGGITSTIIELETKIADLQNNLNIAEMDLRNAVSEKTLDEKEISNHNKKITDLRKEWNLVKLDLSRLLFASHVNTSTSSEEIDIPHHMNEEKLEELTLRKLVVIEQTTGKGIFDVSFRACTGPETLKEPVVVITSDKETKNVNLSSRIIPHSCQTSGTKIVASSSDDIKISFGGSSERTVIITDLENQIRSLTEEFNTLKAEYEKFLVKSQTPQEYDDHVVEKASKIEDLRLQIMTEKAKLYKYLTEIYE